jgi:hypothetical protein
MNEGYYTAYYSFLNDVIPVRSCRGRTNSWARSHRSFLCAWQTYTACGCPWLLKCGGGSKIGQLTHLAVLVMAAGSSICVPAT